MFFFILQQQCIMHKQIEEKGVKNHILRLIMIHLSAKHSAPND